MEANSLDKTIVTINKQQQEISLKKYLALKLEKFLKLILILLKPRESGYKIISKDQG